ncbi:universal stress protein A [Marmoricola endophyticus]|uniref:Universal stress protein A n=1 Tax=Marmoricola endophyticus TaxID=2040280 RepID=A0A917BLW3_9ACTN|nr:universal stress protein [Marmoricola endophyticus]GGF48683.1 universal stress protein A [Marmoricola endophyticus]
MQQEEYELGTDGPRLILVGVDGSETSIRAGSFAAGVARREGAELLAVFVTQSPAFAGSTPGGDPSAAYRGEEIEEMRQRVEEGAAYVGHPIRFRTAHGDPFSELTRIAEEERADSVIVGASASAGHRFVGSLAVRLVKAGRWPVTVVP